MKLFILSILPLLAFTGMKDSRPSAPDLVTWLKENNCRAAIRFCQHDFQHFSKPLETFSLPVVGNDLQEARFMDGVWQLKLSTSRPANAADAMDIELTCKLKEGVSPQTSIVVDFTFDNWSASNYVLLPAAAYNGNRFESRRIAYSPKLLDPRDIGPDKPMIISDVPRLNIKDGPSCIQARSGAMSVPAIGFQSASTQTGFLLFTKQATKWGDTGLGIEESRDRGGATISITVPVVREGHQYRITDNQAASQDRAPDFKSGDEFTLKFRLYFFPCPQTQDLFDRYFGIRNELANETQLKPLIPFSSCFAVQEKKFNEQNWVDEYGYYSVGMRENFLQDWQIGWTGGMISTYPLLAEGNDTSRQHVLRNFDWLFPDGIGPAGFFWDAGEKGTKWYGGDIRKPQAANWHLIRKSGDGLYYVIKQLMLMDKEKIEVKAAWKSGATQVADAFARLWERWGQFGQFVDSRTGDVVVGGSTSGAIVPAALVLASRYFNRPDYLRVAQASGAYFYDNYILKGITCGGPGDALQNPDSESAYAMIESFMLLFESTGEIKWLDRARETANQFSTWVMPYDFHFPPNSALGKLGVQTKGIVFANTQNTHGAPGICCYSGIALWRLFRATGDVRYMQLLRDIAFVMPQYLSHPLRPIDKMKIGWMSERVSTTDWLEGIGELMYGSTWAETSLMLAYTELPGAYIQPDKSLLLVLDNIEAKIVSDNAKSITVMFSNPTRAVAKLRIFVETSKQALQALGENAMWNAPVVQLNPGESKVLSFKK